MKKFYIILNRIKKQVALAKIGIMDAVHFRLAMFVMIFSNFLYFIVVYFLWKAIYASSETNNVNGMTFSDTLIYLVLAASLSGIMEMYTVWEIGRNIQTGKIILDLLKPINYRDYLFGYLFGRMIVQFLVTFVPTFVIVYITTDSAISVSVNLIFFLVSIIFSVALNYSIDFIAGTVCLYTESMWGINIMKQVVVSLLSGATIPLVFFPEYIRKYILALPFASICNTPIQILMSSSLRVSFLIKSIGVQGMWCFILMICGNVFWSISIRKITINGG